MTSDPNPSRRYTDEEVRRLLTRASELETQGASLPAKIDGPTLTDLEAIASEAGIDPAMVRRAARELDSPSGGITVLAPQSSVFWALPRSSSWSGRFMERSRLPFSSAWRLTSRGLRTEWAILLSWGKP